MKWILSLWLLIGLALAGRADIAVTNIVPLTSYSAATNTSAQFVAPQSHAVSPLSISMYHSATNASFPTTNILQVTFDGGTTWANVATYVNSTNVQNETWAMTQSTLSASNRVLVITKTNQTLYYNANWSR